MSIESLVVDLIEGRKKKFAVLPLLFFFSQIYRCLVFIRNFLYERGIFRSYTSCLPVISVGNLSAGGTGKTPFVQKLTEELGKNPGEIAIVGRGYRSKGESESVLVSEGQGPLVAPSLCGDEAYWLAVHTNASVWIGKKRVKNIQTAETTHAKILCLEDGFQHRQVQRQIDIVLLHAQDVWGQGYLLPRGFLREPPKNLARADWIVLTYLESEQPDPKMLEEIRKFSKAPILGFSSRYRLPSQVKGKKVGAFCGIGRPQSFYRALEKEGAQILQTMSLPDHCLPSLKELGCFIRTCKAKGAQWIVCTEKDFVKLELGRTQQLELPIAVLEMQFECVWNEKMWKEMIQSIQTKM